MYTPSYLESIDVSYNEIPILTQEITVGTNKVKYLNLSHNSIDEIRPGTNFFTMLPIEVHTRLAHIGFY